MQGSKGRGQQPVCQCEHSCLPQAGLWGQSYLVPKPHIHSQSKTAWEEVAPPRLPLIYKPTPSPPPQSCLWGLYLHLWPVPRRAGYPRTSPQTRTQVHCMGNSSTEHIVVGGGASYQVGQKKSLGGKIPWGAGPAHLTKALSRKQRFRSRPAQSWTPTMPKMKKTKKQSRRTFPSMGSVSSSRVTRIRMPEGSRSGAQHS